MKQNVKQSTKQQKSLPSTKTGVWSGVTEGLVWKLNITRCMVLISQKPVKETNVPEITLKTFIGPI